MNELINLRHLSFSYPKKEPALVIENFSMDVGEKLFLYGPSGCGKSTLLNLIAGTLEAQTGELHVCGRDMARLTSSGRDRHRGEHIGYIFQSFNLINYLTVYENVMLPAIVSREKGSASDVNKQASELIEHLGLTAFRDQKAGQLSIGQRQRVAAARALVGLPKLIIADEPTSSLDEANTEAFMQLLLEQANLRKLGILFVSHDKRLERYFDRSVELPQINQASLS